MAHNAPETLSDADTFSPGQQVFSPQGQNPGQHKASNIQTTVNVTYLNINSPVTVTLLMQVGNGGTVSDCCVLTRLASVPSPRFGNAKCYYKEICHFSLFIFIFIHPCVRKPAQKALSIPLEP